MVRKSLCTGIVTGRDGPRFLVEIEAVELSCMLRGRLRQEAGRVSTRVVVGDQVDVKRLEDGSGAIEAVHPRRSELVRPGFGGVANVMAANVDPLVIVQSAGQPPFQRPLVERFLATAHRGRMGAVIVVNKCDLETDEVIRGWVEPVRASNTPVILTSTRDGRGIEELRAALQGRISVLAGKSGVGKSSLVNALYPGMDARTSAVSEALNKGRHTTTTSRLYPIPGGGYLADTPGIRTLALFEDEQAVEEVFPEITAAADGCKFRNCSHTHEAKCAVREAVERGTIHPDRYQHYVRLQRGG